MQNQNLPIGNPEALKTLREWTWWAGHSTAVWDGGTSFSSKKLFEHSSANDKYQNTTFKNIRDEREVHIAGISATFDLEFAAVNSEDTDRTLIYALERSTLDFKISDKEYSGISLLDVIPFHLWWDGTALQISPKSQSQFIFHLQTPIIVDEESSIALTLNTADGLTLATSANTNPPLPQNGGITTNAYGYYTTVKLHGVQKRKVA